jgi:stearoyl-CoA desaturase (delta-9 desaturase)
MVSARAAQARGWQKTYLHLATIPYWGVHVMALIGIVLLGWSWAWFGVALASYAVRMFFVTGAYHRYFSHRSYKTSRPMQLVLAFGAVATVQRGPLWWAAHHRRHHAGSDTEDDLHSPYHGGFWWSHMGWLMSPALEDTDHDKVKDLVRYPELRWLDRWWLALIVLQAVGFQVALGWEGLVYGFALPTVLCWHGTFTINSLSHLWGSRRYATTDHSRNNPVLALITLGEGWHNNHHHYQRSARQGFFWWEYDITYYVLRGLAAVGLIWDLHGVPEHVRAGVRKAAPGRPVAEPAVVALPALGQLPAQAEPDAAA